MVDSLEDAAEDAAQDAVADASADLSAEALLDITYISNLHYVYLVILLMMFTSIWKKYIKRLSLRFETGSCDFFRLYQI